MPADYRALQAAWNRTSGATAQRLAQINSMETTSGEHVDVSVESIKQRLGPQKLTHLQIYALDDDSTERMRERLKLEHVSKGTAAADHFMALLGEGPVLRLSDDNTRASVESMLTTIATDALSGISTHDIQALLGLSIARIPFWVSAGFRGPISPIQLHEAGVT